MIHKENLMLTQSCMRSKPNKPVFTECPIKQNSFMGHFDPVYESAEVPLALAITVMI